MSFCPKHRPYPLPASPWVMKQSWHDLLFAHWRVPVESLRQAIPACFDVDVYEGEAWVGVVPFTMSGVVPRFVPAIPYVSKFPEVNVRTYVKVGGKPGVYFFSLDAASRLAVETAKLIFRLPYFHAKMSVRAEGETIHYSSTRLRPVHPEARMDIWYRPVGSVVLPTPGSLEYWLTERYCLYTADCRNVQSYICEIHHAPWPLQIAEAEICHNSLASAAGLSLPDQPTLLHFSKRQDVQIWPLLKCR